MGETPPLPHCCKCHLDLSKVQLKGLNCSHAYCQQCVLNTFNCLVCVTGTSAPDNQFPELPGLYRAYQSAPSPESYSKMFEVINVNEVECVQGSACKHRGWCKYTHPGAILVEDGSWLCLKCNINIEKAKNCPMCGQIQVIQADPPPKPEFPKNQPPAIEVKKETENKQSFSWFGAFCCCYSREKKGESKPLLSKKNDS